MNTGKGIYKIPLILVDTNRTKYYSEKDGFVKDSEEWKEEMNFIMNDDFEGLDWLQNNMYLSDIEPFMIKVEDTRNDDWFNDSDNFEISNE